MSKIEPLYPHYSMQNCPTVFDEEAMTALEMCGRLGHKVNEIITAVNGWQVPQIVNVSPTGDKTGELDRVVIQGKLDKGYAVHLSAGEYYLNGPLIFRPGYMLRGDSQLNTVLNCKAGFIDHENIVSVDHVEVRDVRVKGPGSGVGIDISRKAQGVETGGRYAHFMNVYITGYDTAVRLGGCWCTNFTHCRIEAENICVEQRGSCNHVRYDHCMFLGPVDSKTTTGVKITAEDGAENYGISFDHCEFERHDKAIHAYYCIALNVDSIYAEGVNTIFQLDSCPGFLCDGGYISYPERVCNTARTNTAPVFSKCNGAIKNLYVRVNSSETFYLVSTGSNAPLDVENINCVNDSTGECIVNAQCANSVWNGHEHHLVTRQTLIVPENLGYGWDPFWAGGTREHAEIGYKNKPNNRFKVQEVSLYPAQTFTATKSATLKITAEAKDIGLEGVTASTRITLFEGFINSGQNYAKGGRIVFTAKAPYRNLIISNLKTLSYEPSTSDFGANFNGLLEFTIVSGEMIL